MSFTLIVLCQINKLLLNARKVYQFSFKGKAGRYVALINQTFDVLIFYFFFNMRGKDGVFWVNIAKSKLNLLYRYCLKLIGELRKEKEFWQQCCRNSTKIRERKRKRWREKEEEFRQHCYQNSSAQIPARLVSCVLKKAIAAMPLPK